ncbi:MAG: glycosyltransferase family 9 protein [bacterium]
MMKSAHSSLTGPILIVRTDALGDLVMTLPMLTMLKRSCPSAEVDILVSKRAAPVIEGHRNVRNVLVDPGNLRQRVKLIGRGEYEWVIVVRPEPGIALAVWLSGIPRRVGTSRRFYSLLFNHRWAVARKHGGRHEAEYNAELLSPLGIATGRVPWVNLKVTDTQRNAAREILNSSGLSPEMAYVVVHPGSRGSAPNLPYETYAGIVRGLRKREIAVVLTGSRTETAPLIARLKDPAGGNGRGEHTKGAPLVDLSGKTDLAALLGVLAGARLVIASSTGPLHLASAVGTPVVSAYGHRPSIAAQRWKPWVDPQHVTLLNPGEAACPSSCKGRCGRNGCLATIQVEAFLKAVDSRLKGIV